MAITAEVLSSPGFTDFALWEAELAIDPAPRQQVESVVVYDVSRLELDLSAREKARRFIGQAVAGAEFAVTPETAVQATGSLMEAVHKAEVGDVVAEQMVAMNVRTDVIERTIKAGHVMKVGLAVNEQGQVVQYGQTAEAIQANSLRFAANNWQMRERTEAETRNMFRIDDLRRQGRLDDYAFVVISRAADNMTLEQAGEVGFFTDTMSCAIQVTTAEADGLTTESAFVAGKTHRDAPRHDAETVARLGRRLGVNLEAQMAAQTIDTPLLIPKRLMPNGVIDVVRWYDEAAGGTFFGQATPPCDYGEYLRQCQQREAELEPTVQAITRELITAGPTIQTPLEATQRLHELSETHLLRRALVDERIDATVFGVESAVYLEAARYHHSLGDSEQVELFLAKSEAVAASSSCPGGGKLAAEQGSEAGAAMATADNGEAGDCEFVSKKCPMCGTKNVKTMVRKGLDGKKHISGSCGCSKVA